MVDLRVARRYARALLEVALKQEQLQRIADDLTNLRTLVEQSGQLRAFFNSPLIPRDRKIERLREALAPHLHPAIMRLIELLVEKRREKLLEPICDEFQKLYETHQGILRAQIESAVPLTESEQHTLVQQLERSTGKRIIPTFAVDPNLIGGVRVQLGDYQIDGTLRGALNRLREQITLEIERRGTRAARAE